MTSRTYAFLIALLFLFSCQTTPENKPAEGAERSGNNIPDNTIINLYDAFGKSGNGMKKDFGFSALIKYNGKLILFDAGTNADFLKQNTEALGIDLKEVDFAMGSHAHGDHLDGFDYLLELNPDVKIYLPFDSRVGAPINFNIAGREKSIVDSLPAEMRYFGGTEDDLNPVINYTWRFWNANAEFVRENVEIEPGIKIVATQSLFMGYASKYPSVEDENSMVTNTEEIQFEGLPELSLSLSTGKGEVLIVGCSHSSVQKIMKETKELTNENIYLLFGGYHLLPYGRDELNAIARQLKEDFAVQKIAPAHCTGHLAFKLLKESYGEDYIFAGLGEQISME